MNRVLLATFMLSVVTPGSKAQVMLVKDGKPEATIVLAPGAAPGEIRAAEILSDYVERMSGSKLPVAKRNPPAGMTSIQIVQAPLTTGEFEIIAEKNKLSVKAPDERRLRQAIYHVLDRYLGCRKFSTGAAFVPKRSTVSIPYTRTLEKPAFSFRQVFYPGQYDAEYRDWHKLQLFEDDWGLWGHSFDKLVPAATWFTTHPEYYALVNGERNAAQLCLSNPGVLRIAILNLGKLIAEQPQKTTWSVAQNDGPGFCTCPACHALDQRYGGQQGSILHFVNQIAARFPAKTISTLAYGYSRHPPTGIRPAANVQVMISTIDLDRSKPLATNPRTAAFRNDLKGWTALTRRLLVWDYVVQFTHYFSPFPNIRVLGPDLAWFARSGVSGVFIQGTEDVAGEFSGLKAYLLARGSWDPTAGIARDLDEYAAYSYGKAAPFILQYIRLLEGRLDHSGRPLDIYGDPAAEWDTWLRPGDLDAASTLLDQAEDQLAGDPAAAKNVSRERLALEYAVLQQARLYGLRQHGSFETQSPGWRVKPGFSAKIDRFIAALRQHGVRQLDEEGLTPDAYAAEWKSVLSAGPLLHDALGAPVTLDVTPSPEYRNFGPATLTDGAPGYDRFQYNYLGWYGVDMIATVDLGEITKIGMVSAGFLEDQRHWAFLPVEVIVTVSPDGRMFNPVAKSVLSPIDEEYQRNTKRVQITLPDGTRARFVRFTAINRKTLPPWRNFPGRRAWLFCDELMVKR